MDELDRGGGAHRCLSPLFTSAEQYEEGAQTLAPRGKRRGGLGPQALAVIAPLLAQQILHPAEAGRQPAARRVEDRRDGRRYGGGAGHPRTPLWIAMIPPARTVQRMRSSPAASIISARRRGGGKLRTDSGR